MKVFADPMNLILASNFSPYRPGASSIPSSLAMASGLTGRRHMRRAMRVALATASMSRGGVTSSVLTLSGFACEDFPFPLIEFLSGFVIDFLGAVQTVVGPA